MQKIRIEGFSKESMNAALADAMAKASTYLSETFDVSIRLLELGTLPGRGYKAVLEITILPMGEGGGLRISPKIVKPEEHPEKEFKEQKARREKHLKQLIQDHFAYKVYNFLPDTPDYYLSDIDHIRVLNYEFEKAFFKATHDLHDVPLVVLEAGRAYMRLAASVGVVAEVDAVPLADSVIAAALPVIREWMHAVNRSPNSSKNDTPAAEG